MDIRAIYIKITEKVDKTYKRDNNGINFMNYLFPCISLTIKCNFWSLVREIIGEDDSQVIRFILVDRIFWPNNCQIITNKINILSLHYKNRRTYGLVIPALGRKTPKRFISLRSSICWAIAACVFALRFSNGQTSCRTDDVGRG